jgi:CBS domain-containing protein
MHDLSLAMEFLHHIPPFSALETAELENVARKLEAAYYPRGKTIFASDAAPGLALIRKGAVRLVDADHRFLDKRSEGELFGHAIHFHGELRDYIAEADEDCLVWQLPQAEFERLCAEQPQLAEYFGSRLQTRLQAAARVDQAATRVQDLLKRSPVRAEAGASIQEASRLMSRENVSSVLVMEGGQLVGIVTDKDLRQRVIAAGVDPAEPIAAVMTASPSVLSGDEEVDAALLLMMRENYHHLPIVDGDSVLGLLTAGDILRSQTEHPLRLVRDIRKRGSVGELLRLSRRLPSLFERMVAMGRDVEQIGRMVTRVTDAFTVRLIELAQQELGDAPMSWAWVAFGSQAREEQAARTDQDNGIILEREASGEEAEYFSSLARRVCEGLDALGYVYCPGEVMALNAKWRVSLERWQRHFDGWVEEPEPQAVMHCSIFFDMRCVHGDDLLVKQLLEHAIGRAGDNRIFRRFLAANALTHRPPIGFFRRFVQEDDGSHSEGLNLKHRGTVPITDLVRLRALEAGISEANTFRRIELAAAAGVMNERDAGSLRDALVLINRIRFRHQARQMAAGMAPSNFVPPGELSPLMRRNLKAAFNVVSEAQDALSLRYQVH